MYLQAQEQLVSDYKHMKEVQATTRSQAAERINTYEGQILKELGDGVDAVITAALGWSLDDVVKSKQGWFEMEFTDYAALQTAMKRKEADIFKASGFQSKEAQQYNTLAMKEVRFSLYLGQASYHSSFDNFELLITRCSTVFWHIPVALNVEMRPRTTLQSTVDFVEPLWCALSGIQLKKLFNTGL